jgi:hypothetical protein
MPKRLLDGLALFGRARLDVTIPTGPVRRTQGRDAVNLLDMSDPPRFRDEAVMLLHELLDLGVRGRFRPPRSCLPEITPISATSTVVTASGRLGRLRKGFMWQPRLAMLLLVLDERVEERLQ